MYGYNMMQDWSLPTQAGIMGWSAHPLFPFGISVFLLLIVWTVTWKGLALWRAARNEHLAWFIILLLVNTLGILDIAYILLFSEPKKNGWWPWKS